MYILAGVWVKKLAHSVAGYFATRGGPIVAAYIVSAGPACQHCSSLIDCCTVEQMPKCTVWEWLVGYVQAQESGALSTHLADIAQHRLPNGPA